MGAMWMNASRRAREHPRQLGHDPGPKRIHAGRRPLKLVDDPLIRLEQLFNL